jgi:hypothetical protein
MDDCIAEFGATYIGGGTPCTPRGGAPQRGGRHTLTLTLEGPAQAPNTGGRTGPTGVLYTYGKLQLCKSVWCCTVTV